MLVIQGKNDPRVVEVSLVIPGERLASTFALTTEIVLEARGTRSGQSSAIEIGSVRISRSQILIVGTALAMVALLLALMRGTRLGLAIRALAENPDVARLMGVDVTLVTFFVSFVSGTLGAAAGILIGLNYNAIQPYMGEAMMLKGFAVIIIGGLGDIRGALIAGLILGLLEGLTAGYVTSTLKDAVGFLLLVLTLWFRPVGLFGRAAARRA